MEPKKEKIEKVLKRHLSNKEIEEIIFLLESGLENWIEDIEVNKILSSENPKTRIYKKIDELKPKIEEKKDLFINLFNSLIDVDFIYMLEDDVKVQLRNIINSNKEISILYDFFQKINFRAALFVEIIYFIYEFSKKGSSIVVNSNKFFKFEDEMNNVEDEIYFKNFMELIHVVGEDIYKLFIQLLLSCDDIKKNKVVNRYKQSLGVINNEFKNSNFIWEIKNSYYLENIHHFRNAKSHNSWDYDVENNSLIIVDKNVKQIYNRKEIDEIYIKLSDVLNFEIIEFLFYYLLNEVFENNFHKNIFELFSNSHLDENQKLKLLAKDNVLFEEVMKYYQTKYFKNKNN